MKKANCLLNKIALKDPKESFLTYRTSESCSNFLFCMKMQSRIQQQDTSSRQLNLFVFNYAKQILKLFRISENGHKTQTNSNLNYLVDELLRSDECWGVRLA